MEWESWVRYVLALVVGPALVVVGIVMIRSHGTTPENLPRGSRGRSMTSTQDPTGLVVGAVLATTGGAVVLAAATWGYWT